MIVWLLDRRRFIVNRGYKRIENVISIGDEMFTF